MSKAELQQADFLADDGKSLYQAKKYLPAAESYQKAADGYHALGNSLLEAEMRNNQCVALLQAQEPRRALEAVQGTEEIFLEAGQLTKAGMALANKATALKELGRRESALEIFSRAGEIFQSANEDALFLQTMQSVSSLKFHSRDLLGALFAMQEGLEGVEKLTWRQRLLKKLLRIPDKLLNN